MGKINSLATRRLPDRVGKARLLMLAMLFVAACDRDHGAAGRSRKDDVSDATAPIVERQAIANEAAAPRAVDKLLPLQGASATGMKPAPPSSETRYRAIGTEPFWAVTVRGSNLTLERPDHAPLHLPIARTDDGRAVRYLGDGLAMVVTEGPCSDGMSDAVWADRVSVAFAQGTLKGCGGVREDF